MTDKEIIKALECLTGESIPCKDCSYSANYTHFDCQRQVAKDALDLINRQMAEYNNLLEQFRILDCECERLEKTDEKSLNIAEDNLKQIIKDITRTYPSYKMFKTQETQNKLTGEQKQSDYTMKTRAGNIAKYLEQNPNAQLSKNASETFASYSSKFMPKGETL